MMFRISAVAALTLGAQAYAGPVFIDRFQDFFEEEEFITSAGGTINATGMSPSLDVDLITLNLVQDTSALEAVDFSTTSFYAVPTPGALALAGIAGIAVLKRRR